MELTLPVQHCNEKWMGNEDECPVGAYGFNNWKRKLVDTEGQDVFGIYYWSLKFAMCL
jgi:hypothetical protein